MTYEDQLKQSVEKTIIQSVIRSKIREVNSSLTESKS